MNGEPIWIAGSRRGKSTERNFVVEAARPRIRERKRSATVSAGPVTAGAHGTTRADNALRRTHSDGLRLGFAPSRALGNPKGIATSSPRLACNAYLG